jgi:hypothetical protein
LDLILKARAGRKSYTLLCEVKSVGEPRYLYQAIGALNQKRKATPDAYPIVVAPYISPEGRRLCQDAAVGYVDLTGNVFLQFDGILIERSGETVPREARTRARRLFSPKSTRVLRVLLENPKVEWSFLRLAAECEVSLRTAYVVINTLADKGYVQKQRKAIALISPSGLLDLWGENYSVDENPRESFFSFIRSPAEFQEQFAAIASKRRLNYAFTLHSGASLITPFVRYTDVHFYLLGDTGPIIAAMDLRPVETGGTVHVLHPFDEGVLYRTQEVQGKRVVGNVQLYLDLLRYPARGKEQADVLRKKKLSF